ncbi:MAG: phosphate signaling complex protein PhoU [Candidatus Bathyarchaeia archaeon]
MKKPNRLIDAGLDQLKNMLSHMGELAYKTVSTSINGYIKGENTFAEVSNQSDILTSIAEEAETKVFELIARFQPVASDLRILKSYMKITYDFARYGRYALDVAQICERLDGVKECEEWIKDLIVEMSSKVLDMISVSVNSLKNHDVRLAKTLSEMEKHIDELYFKYLDILVVEAPTTTRCTISSVLVVRYLERIADHATYIGESVIYLATGDKVTLR